MAAGFDAESGSNTAYEEILFVSYYVHF